MAKIRANAAKIPTEILQFTAISVDFFFPLSKLVRLSSLQLAFPRIDSRTQREKRERGGEREKERVTQKQTAYCKCVLRKRQKQASVDQWWKVGHRYGKHVFLQSAFFFFFFQYFQIHVLFFLSLSLRIPSQQHYTGRIGAPSNQITERCCSKSKLKSNGCRLNFNFLFLFDTFQMQC